MLLLHTKEIIFLIIFLLNHACSNYAISNKGSIFLQHRNTQPSKCVEGTSVKERRRNRRVDEDVLKFRTRLDP